MQGVQITQTAGFDKLLWESVQDTYAGGVTVDGTAAAAAYSSDMIIPAGTPIGRPDSVTGLCPIVTASGSAGAATFNKVILGYTYRPVKIDNNPLVALVVAGQMRYDAAPTNVQNYWDDFHKALPTVRINRY